VIGVHDPFLLLLAQAETSSWLEWFKQWAKVTENWELWLVGFGILAQATFFGRWIVQWLASERRGHSHMPELFWWLSLVGASMLLVYFYLRGEPVGMLGQSVGWIIYGRNLQLLHRARKKQEKQRTENQCGQCGHAKGPTPGEHCPECGYDWQS